MELFVTVISGVLIFVLGQLLLKLVIEPLQEFKKEIALTLNSLFFHKDKISNPNANLIKKDIWEVSSILRKHSSNLEAKSSIIPLYDCWYKLRILPSKKNIKKATNKLIGLSNSLSPYNYNSGIENSFQVKKVKTALTTYSQSSIIKSLIITIIVLLSIYFLNSAINNAVKLYCDNNQTKIKLETR